MSPQKSPRQGVYPRQKAVCALNAVPPRPAKAAVALAEALGSRTVEMSAIESLTTHGPRASRLAKVL